MTEKKKKKDKQKLECCVHKPKNAGYHRKLEEVRKGFF